MPYRRNLDAAFLAAASTPSGANPLVTAAENPLTEESNVVKLKTGFGTNGFLVGTEATEIAKTAATETKLLLHMDDAGLTDSAGKTVTLYGSLTRSNTQSKFGSYSASFNGSSQYMTIDEVMTSHSDQVILLLISGCTGLRLGI